MSDVEIGQQEVSFSVDEVGVPVLVKVSYFPNWSVDGAEGPYRVAPNLMVVVPTEQDVRLHYDRSRSDLFFYFLTFAGIALLVFFRVKGDVDLGRRSPSAGGRAPPDDRTAWRTRRTSARRRRVDAADDDPCEARPPDDDPRAEPGRSGRVARATH